MNNSLDYNVVFAFDNSLSIKAKEYETLIKLCDGHKIYILSLNNYLKGFEIENVCVIDFYEELSSNPNYILADRIHLTEDGNNALIRLLTEKINVEKIVENEN